LGSPRPRAMSALRPRRYSRLYKQCGEMGSILTSERFSRLSHGWTAVFLSLAQVLFAPAPNDRKPSQGEVLHGREPQAPADRVRGTNGGKVPRPGHCRRRSAADCTNGRNAKAATRRPGPKKMSGRFLPSRPQGWSAYRALRPFEREVKSVAMGSMRPSA
jgi:hypothetical protein